jgi:hypothetical protein
VPERSVAARLVWLWAFLGLLVIGALSAGRQTSFILPPNPSAPDPLAADRPSLAGAAAVLPFDDLRVPDRGSATDPNSPSLTPEPMRRQGAQVVYQLGAAANRLGTVDGRTFTEAFTQDLRDSGMFQAVNSRSSYQDLQGEGFLISGKILEAEMRVKDGGDAQYSITVELTASRPASGEVPEREFFKKSFNRMASASGVPTPFEIGVLVRALDDDAIAALAEKLKKEIASPSQASGEAGAADQSAPVPADSTDTPPAAE